MKRIAWWVLNKDRVLKDKRKKIRDDPEKKTPGSYIVEQEEDEEEEPAPVDPVHIPLGGKGRDEDKNDGEGGDDGSGAFPPEKGLPLELVAREESVAVAAG